MYFSVVAPTPGRERDAAFEWACGAYAEHQWLWRFFPAQAGTRRDFLFRRQDVEGFPRFYVISKRQPRANGSAWQVMTRDYAPDVEAGARLHFDLRANPVVTRSIDGTMKRHDVVMDEKKRLLRARGLSHWEDWNPARSMPDGRADPPPPLYDLVQRTCIDWLKARAGVLGFAVDENDVVAEAYQQHRGKRDQLQFSTVDFVGELIVTDREAFARTLLEGVGRAKAFGCGLLLVRRSG